MPSKKQPTRQSATFRERANQMESSRTPSPTAEAQPQRRSYDPTRAPAGYDQDYWGMALLFRDKAMADDINLRAGVPVIYTETRRMFEWFDLEHGSRPFERRGDGHVERTYAQVYRDGTGKQLTWQEVGYAIIEEFWDRYWDDDALQYFCDLDVFLEIADYVVTKWLNKRGRAWLARQPKKEPQPMEWKHDESKRRRNR